MILLSTALTLVGGFIGGQVYANSDDFKQEPVVQFGSGEAPELVEIVADACVVYRGGEDVEYITVCES